MRRIGPIVLGILTLLAVAVLSLMGLRWVKAQRGLAERVTARDVIHEQVRVILMNQGVLKMAARFGASPGNAELGRCLLPHEDGAPFCTVTSPAAQVSFALPEGNEKDAPLVAGDVTKPAPYGRFGAIGCKDQEEECPGWMVTAWFWAECANQVQECAQASKLHVRYLVQGVGSNVDLPAIPPVEAFQSDPSAFAETVEVTGGGVP